MSYLVEKKTGKLLFSDFVSADALKHLVGVRELLHNCFQKCNDGREEECRDMRLGTRCQFTLHDMYTGKNKDLHLCQMEVKD